MGIEIDRLDVQVEAQASDANKQLDKMISKLEKVCSALCDINGSGITEFAYGVRELGSSVKTFSSVKASDFTKLANGLMKISKVPSGSLWNTSYAVGGLAKNLGELNGVSFDVAGLMNVANTLTKFGSKTGTVGTENLTKIKDYLANFVAEMNGVGSVTFDIESLLKLSASISKLGGEKATQAARNLPAMSVYLKKFISDLNGVGSVTFDLQGLSELVGSISKLGGKASTQSIKNIPNLAKAMSDLMATLSSAPTVSQDIIVMTNSLALLASQGSKTGSAANAISNSINSYGNAADRATKKTKSLASVIGSLNANFFWIKRITDKLYKFTGSSMDFLETVNYFEVAMREIGDSAAMQWEENGYASAEAYAESFAKRAKQLTEKMTGYSIDSDGNATYLGVKNLGMDPDKVLQYQATFAQISSSMGVAEESALNFSKALTMLGADWASLRNLTFEQGWEKFASALAGQSRAVRTLGIDITNATLQEYAYKYGLEMAVSEMNQATKAQLRLLAILDQSEVAFGDLANTIESPANQIRMLQQNVSNLGRVFGNLFLPILQVTLPYINGVTIALQNLMIWLGKLLGIKFDAINSATGGISDDIAGIADGADDVGGALDDANESAKKLNKTLRNWDEINNITTKDNSGSSGTVKGGGNALLDDEIAKALEDYEKIWNEAFDRMENKAQKFAEKIEKYLKPLKDIIEDFSVGDFFKAGQDTSTLIAGILNFFADAIDKVDWYKIGQNMGDYLAGIDWIKILESVAHVFWEGLKAAFELWSGIFSNAPFETLFISLSFIPKLLTSIVSSKFVTGIMQLATKFKTLSKNASGFMQNLDSTGQVLTFNKGITAIRNNLTKLQKGTIGVTAVFSEFFLLKDGFYDLVKGSDNLIESIAEIAVGAGVSSGALYLAFGPAGLAVAGVTALIGSIVGIKSAIDDINAECIGKTIYDAFNTPNGVPVSELTDNLTNSLKEASSKFDYMSESSQKMEDVRNQVSNVWMEIDKIKIAMDNGVLSVEQGKQELERLFGELAILAGDKFGQMSNDILLAFGENGALRTVNDSMVADTQAAIDSMITYCYQGSERANEIVAELAGMDFNDPRYQELMQELAMLTGEMDDFSAATEGFANQIDSLKGKVNFQDLIGENGELDVEKLTEYFNESKKALDDYNKTLDDARVKYEDYFNDVIENPYATKEQKIYAEQMIQYLNESIDGLREDAKSQVNDFSDFLQKEYLRKTSDVIKSAQEDWNSFGLLELTALNFTDAYNETEYVKKSVAEVEKNFALLQNAITDSFGEITEESTKAGRSYARSIFDGIIIEAETNGSDYDVLREDYNEFINGVLEDVPDIANDIGTQTIESFGSGMVDGISFLDESASEIGNCAEKNLDSMVKKFKQYGSDSVDGLISGIDERKKQLEDKMKEIANMVQKSFANSLEIHSPSRVMFELGENTMEGYQLGVESLYSSIEKSLGGFSEAVVVSATPSSFMDNVELSRGLISQPDSENYSYFDGNSYDYSETNALLRELLSEVRKGHVIECSGEALGKTIRREDQMFYDTTGVGMFEH